MKTKKSPHLLIMLAVLIAHTLLLSKWLSDGEAVHRKANVKSETQEEEINQLPALKTSVTSHKDSIHTLQSIGLTKKFSSQLK